MWDSKENYVLATRAGPPCQSGIKTIPLPHADIAHWKDVLINPSLGAHLLCSPLPVPLLVHSSNQRNLIKTEGTHLSRASLSRKKGERKIRRGWRGPLWSLLIRSQGAPPLWRIWVTLWGAKSTDAGGWPHSAYGHWAALPSTKPRNSRLINETLTSIQRNAQISPERTQMTIPCTCIEKQGWITATEVQKGVFVLGQIPLFPLGGPALDMQGSP